MARDATFADRPYVVELHDVLGARRQQRRELAGCLPRLDQGHPALGPEAMHQVVVAINLPLVAVKRLDTLELIGAFAEVDDSRTRHRTSGAHYESALEIASPGRLVNTPKPLFDVARLDQRIARLRPHWRCKQRSGEQQRGQRSQGSQRGLHAQRDPPTVPRSSNVALRRKPEGTPSAELPPNCLWAARY